MNEPDPNNRGAAGPLARTDSLSVTPIAPPDGSRPSGSRGTSSRGTSSRVEIDLTQTIVAPTDQSLQAVKWIVLAVMLTVAVLIGLRLALVEGLVAGIGRGVRIDGPSMAPALVGGHYRVKCADCSFIFAASADNVPKNERACCPNCGYQNNDLREEDLVLGQRVVIDRWPLVRGRPRVGDVVAAVDPRTPGEMVVKRVAGLPGQRLGVRRGDLLADGEVVRKSLAELRKVRVLVHDNRFEPKNSGLSDRWSSARPGTDWHPAMFGYWNTHPP
ncbi:MAG: S26 family signal peptidase, partial [Pirellulaceae bacterium]|nr:S26 family signal peptidase [Pirellulaceae bacterium]